MSTLFFSWQWTLSCLSRSKTGTLACRHPPENLVASPSVVRRLRSAAARFCEPPVFRCSRRSKFSFDYVKTNTKPGCFDVSLEHARLVFSLLSPCPLVSAIWIKVSERCPTCYFIRVCLTPACTRQSGCRGVGILTPFISFLLLRTFKGFYVSS